MKKKQIKALKKINASLKSKLKTYMSLAKENLDEIDSLTEKYNEKVDILTETQMRMSFLNRALDQAEEDIERAERVMKDNVIRENDIAEFTAKMMAYKNG